MAFHDMEINGFTVHGGCNKIFLEKDIHKACGVVGQWGTSCHPFTTDKY
jgi:hypothetical protein